MVKYINGMISLISHQCLYHVNFSLCVNILSFTTHCGGCTLVTEAISCQRPPIQRLQPHLSLNVWSGLRPAASPGLPGTLWVVAAPLELERHTQVWKWPIKGPLVWSTWRLEEVSPTKLDLSGSGKLITGWNLLLKPVI